jgi:hypothetical protein
MKLHIRVLAASKGLKNRLYYVCAESSAVTKSYEKFRIRVYNASLSGSLDGTQDALQLQTVRGKLPMTRILLEQSQPQFVLNPIGP